MTAPAPGPVAALAAAAVLAGSWAAPAGAARPHVRSTSAKRTKVYNTPGGLVVGFLARDAPVIVLKRTHDRRWTDVRAVHSIVGWIPTKELC
jgi:hypothetical protein